MSFITRIKLHYRYNKEELKQFVILALIIGFLLSFNEWGGEKFDAAIGLFNLILAIIIAAIGIFIHDAGQRLTALFYKHKLEAKMWWGGTGISFLICLATNGTLGAYTPILAKSFDVEALKRERIGTYHYRTTLEEVRNIALMGAIFSLLFATILKIIGYIGGISGGVLQKMIIFNVMFAFMHYLPIPPLDGIKIMFESRVIWVAWGVGIFVYGYFTLTQVAIWLQLLLAVVLALLTMYFVYAGEYGK